MSVSPRAGRRRHAWPVKRGGTHWDTSGGCEGAVHRRSTVARGGRRPVEEEGESGQPGCLCSCHICPHCTAMPVLLACLMCHSVSSSALPLAGHAIASWASSSSGAGSTYHQQRATAAHDDAPEDGGLGAEGPAHVLARGLEELDRGHRGGDGGQAVRGRFCSASDGGGGGWLSSRSCGLASTDQFEHEQMGRVRVGDVGLSGLASHCVRRATCSFSSSGGLDSIERCIASVHRLDTDTTRWRYDYPWGCCWPACSASAPPSPRRAASSSSCLRMRRRRAGIASSGPT